MLCLIAIQSWTASASDDAADGLFEIGRVATVLANMHVLHLALGINGKASIRLPSVVVKCIIGSVNLVSTSR